MCQSCQPINQCDTESAEAHLSVAICSLPQCGAPPKSDAPPPVIGVALPPTVLPRLPSSPNSAMDASRTPSMSLAPTPDQIKAAEAVLEMAKGPMKAWNSKLGSLKYYLDTAPGAMEQNLGFAEC